MPGGVVVVGASLGGLRAVEQLRKAGYDGGITVIGGETHMPYNRPPLSKAALQEPLPAEHGTDPVLALARAHAFPLRVNDGTVRWLLGNPAVSTSLDEHWLALRDGSEMPYDGLVIATGLRPRRLGLSGAHAGRHVLRTVEDAAGLRAALVPGANVVIVGGGFIGCEVAASASLRDCGVTIVEPLPEPMLAALGPQLAASIRRHHEDRGIRFELGRTVEAIDDSDQPSRSVTLDDGRRLPCDVVVEAIGSDPNVEWLEGNGLDLSDGVLCDERTRVEGRPDVVAVGDVARYPSPATGATQRVEHWCVPTDTARIAAPSLAAGLAGVEAPQSRTRPVPTFWSDQFNLRIHGLGAFGRADDHELLEGSLDELQRGVVIGASRAGNLVGVLSVGLTLPALRRYRERLAPMRSTVHVA
jgi:NADPH-dependent 2,4-dienoyl-CoA reductase/sulfur reductase-like enzyme